MDFLHSSRCGSKWRFHSILFFKYPHHHPLKMFSQQKRIREENPEKYLHFSNLNSIKSLNLQLFFHYLYVICERTKKEVAPSSAYRM